jgi:hypothetical protein
MAPAEPNAKPFEVKGEAPFFAEERKGWKGYVEWERYPEKKKQAEKILAQYDFPVVSNIATRKWQALTLDNSLLSSNWHRYPTPIPSWRECGGSRLLFSTQVLEIEHVQVLPLRHGPRSGRNARHLVEVCLEREERGYDSRAGIPVQW